MDESTIIKAVKRAFQGNAKYVISNVYAFRHDWESDVFILKDNGYCYEIEVKISRSDFFADQKKVNKHSILKTGYYPKRIHNYGSYIDGKYVKAEPSYETTEHKTRPNRFYYIVPKGLISASEIPDYAGLYYYEDGYITEVKKAPFIYKEKLEFKDKLTNKLYHRLLHADERIELLNRRLKELETTH